MPENQNEEDDLDTEAPEDQLPTPDRPDSEDPRKGWLEAKVRACFYSEKEERIGQLLSSDTVLDAWSSFLDTESVRHFFIFSTADGDFTAQHNAPQASQNRVLYFLKASSTELTMSNIDDQVVVNECHPEQTLKELLTVSQEIFFPLISDGQNQEGWPEVISKEIAESFNRFLANSYITIGQTIGKTLLPLPPQEQVTKSSNYQKEILRDKDRVHMLENAVVTWTKQIKHVLKQEPEVLLQQDQTLGPGAEFDFWSNKADNLNSIHEQLNGEKIRKVMSILELTKSTYYPAFDRLCKEVRQARAESNDNLVFLRPAKKYYDLLHGCEFKNLSQHFRTIMRVTLLVWKHSQFYNTPVRLVVLIREIGNDIIREACAFMAGDGIWSDESKDAVSKLRVIIGQCVDFKDAYFEFKNISEHECEDNPWRFQSSALFARLDSFLERCHDVLDLMQTLTQFNTLDHVEIGGTKGKTLTSSVQQIFLDFRQSISVFKEAPYDVMNIDSKAFEENFYSFRLEVNELERRLASVIIQAFDDSTTILGSFKLLDSFEGLLERDILHSELTKKHADMLIEYLQDMNQVQEIFNIGKKKPMISDNAPPHAGAVSWVRGLLQRVEDPMHRLRVMGKIALDTEEGRESEKAHGAVAKMLAEFERDHIQQWAREVANTSEAKLKLPLLRRELVGGLPLLYVNFDSALVCLIREVKYFLSLNIEVPEAASAIYRNEELFRVQTGNLDLIINLYNHVIRTLLDVEKPLVQQKMDNIDKVLQRGLKHMNWKSHTISEFIAQCTTIVREVHGIVATIKENVTLTQRILASWSHELLIQRKAARTYTPEEFLELQHQLTDKRNAEIQGGGRTIHQHLSNSQKVLRATRGSAQFKAYVDYVNSVVIAGLADATHANCQYLLRQVDPEYLTKHDVNPLLEIQLRLSGHGIIFSPELGSNAEGAGVRDLVFSWITSFHNIGMLVKRIDTPNTDGDYLADIQDDTDVKFSVSKINALITDNEERCEELRLSFAEYAHLWNEDVQLTFAQFLRDETPEGAAKPELHSFEERINTYRLLEDEIRELPGSKVVGWLKIDVRPLRNSLLTCVGRWREAFQQFPYQFVTEKLQELLSFFSTVNTGLDQDVFDSHTLEAVFGLLRDVRKREVPINELFEPLRLTVLMLSKYGVSIPPEVYKDLEGAAVQWEQLKIKAAVTKDRYTSAQQNEAVQLKTRSKVLAAKLADFRTLFLRKMPFEYSEDHEHAYEIIDNLYFAAQAKDAKSDFTPLVQLREESERLIELQDSFELDIMNDEEIAVCTREAQLLKAVWDHVALVVVTQNEWKRVKWADVRIAPMLATNQTLLDRVHHLDAGVWEWSVFQGLKSGLESMQIALPLVELLRHPAMRTRHWKSFMRTTGVSFSMDEKFSLGDLLVLKLHKYEEDVHDIVERSQKELLIENQLQDLESTWSTILLEFEPHSDQSEISIIRVSETVTESLKEHIVQLQHMRESKYVQGHSSFLEAVSRWQTKLGKVDSVVSAWLEVQKRWSNLHSIFLTASDIREQLPSEAKRFDDVDAGWKELMLEAAEEKRVVEACNIAGRLERVEHMLQDLETCERALSSHLETKRMTFPRLYFVADSDLLDVLSKGKYPWNMARHLRSCFDNIIQFDFEEDEEGNLTRRAIGMRSAEGEYVAFMDHFDCEGFVEVWLKNITRHTHYTIEGLLANSLDKLEVTPKKDLIFSECAQVAGLLSRIHFAYEVNQAFDMIDQGEESALRRLHESLRQDIDVISELAREGLPHGDRIKVTTVMTLEVHHRDVLATLNEERVESRLSFLWLAQLRYSMSEEHGQCQACIADYACLYAHEYIGNAGSLVLTPLTRRCYLTLTQAMQLHVGGAPSGPAGVGKTETVKDLGRALGVMVYVFNCTDQMDSQSVGSIFKGLAQVGAWGCFDEFNRIDLSVLSVVGTQFKAVLDAVRYKKERFVFEGTEIALQDSPYCNAYFTMNPDYQGGTEIPENVKALFRPCAMVQPDVELVTEITLMSEGFSKAKELSAKIVSICKLCSNLLSQQKYYDWNLRSIKTTLTLAGQARRAQRGSREDEIVLRVIRDFNLGRLVPADVSVFLGLLNDSFPGLLDALPLQVDQRMEETIRQACGLFKLQPEDSFVHKVLQLRDALDIRWSVFVLGPPGSGKSELIRVLCKAQNLLQDRTVFSAMNPKAVMRDELYGHIHSGTREWKDGLLSQVFRDFAKTKSVKNQYLILDGDVDAQWIESMNTVMDNNKTLTLASNERIQMTDSMRLLFEVGNLTHASPASISRGGVIFVSEAVVGWRSVVASWIADRDHDVERQVLADLFHEYLPRALAFVKANLRHIVPIPTVNHIHTTCFILEGILGSGDELLATFKASGLKEYRRRLEGPFVYSTIWGLAGALAYDRKLKYAELFDRFWRSSFGACPFADPDLVFDYFWDPNQALFEHWSTRTSFALVPDVKFEHMYIATPETLRLSFLQGLLVHEKRAVMFVGFAGTGKTALVKETFRSVDQEIFSITEMDFNYATDSMMLQSTIEGALEQKSGRIFGPSGNKRAIYFIDNLNMPQADQYGTQQPIALLRQHMEYGYWYDRRKLEKNEIHGIQYVTCMNPAAGSFTVDQRLQRQFATFSVEMPTHEMLFRIYSTIASSHFNKFDTLVHKVAAEPMVHATLNLFKSVSETFLPTNVKFYYVFNLREISAVVQGLCRSLRQYYSNPTALIRLWLHECERVFCDRLQSATDIQIFQKMLVDICMKWFDEYGEMDKIMMKPLVFTDFTTTTTDSADRPYCGISDSVKLTRIVEEKLLEYNETHPVMNLVLFDQAVLHVCRTTRILGLPSGNALLIGLGGSGKQSLAKLSAFICGHVVEHLVITPTFNCARFLERLKDMMLKAGLSETRITFIINESQIVGEDLLVAINDFLSTGSVTGLFSGEERTQVHGSLRHMVKQSGTLDSIENCWELFTERCRAYLHMCLCFSPAGTGFRARCRQFPAILNCTSLDFFHPWQQDALVSVAANFLPAMGIPTELVEGISQHMSFVHGAVSQVSEDFLEAERRHNYTTPKSFLVLIDLYGAMLKQRKQEAQEKLERLNSGLHKLYDATEQVTALQSKLMADLDDVQEKTEAANKVLDQVTEETKLADQERMHATGDEENCAAIAGEVAQFKAECDEELKAADPLIQEAIQSLQTLDKKMLLELKGMSSPPPGVEDVTASILILTSKSGFPKDLSWGAAKKMMSNADHFLRSLLAFDKDNLNESACVYCEKNFLSKESFQPDRIKAKSVAAGALCSWVVNICRYYRVYETVKPKIERHAEANKKLIAADKQLMGVRARLQELDVRLDDLTKEYQAATQLKNRAMGRADQTRARAGMAERLAVSLASEGERWQGEVGRMGEQGAALAGDVLLAAAFVCYIGAFTAPYRERLVDGEWKPDMLERRIPLSEGLHPLDLLAAEASRAKWYNQGLPMDRVSTQNAAIVLNTRQWPLLIDPQGRAVTWLKAHLSLALASAASDEAAAQTLGEGDEGDEDDEDDEAEEGGEQEEKESEEKSDPEHARTELTVLQPNHKHFLSSIEFAIQYGESVLIESIGETMDAVLEPILSRAVFKKGRTDTINFAGKDVDFDPNFKLYLQTRLPNPHIRPETAAQTTIVNFMITPDGLHEQLLALVVQKERPELFAQKEELVEEQNNLKIQIQELEDQLLATMSNVEGDVLAMTDLIEGLENTKSAEKELLDRQVDSRAARAEVAAAMHLYVPIADRGVILHGVLSSLWKLDHMYRFSLSHFITFFLKGLRHADEDEDPNRSNLLYPASLEKVLAEQAGPQKVVEEDEEGEGRGRVAQLLESSSLAVFTYASWGVMEGHRLVLATELCTRVLATQGRLDKEVLAALVRGARGESTENPLGEWMDQATWEAAVGVQELQVTREDEEGQAEVVQPLAGLCDDLVQGAKRFREWFQLEAPERVGLPGRWSALPDLERLLVLRALRPDRLVHALTAFVARELGACYLGRDPLERESALEQEPRAPLLFLLSAGADPLQHIAARADRVSRTIENGRLVVVSLGQGQQPVAEAALERCREEGAWLVVQNLHLSAAWTESFLEDYLAALLREEPTGSALKFRLFLSTRPAPLAIGVLQCCIKVTDEAPEGLKTNLCRALQLFDDEYLEQSSKPREFKAVVFALCVLHATIVERRKLGPIGWNRPYTFNSTDLLCCAEVASNYLETNQRIAWTDLRFLFGVVVYGGYITDRFDAVLMNAYLDMFISDGLVEGCELLPGLQTPSWSAAAEDMLGMVQGSGVEDAASVLGLPASAEVALKQRQGRELCAGLEQLGSGSTATMAVGASVQERAGAMIDDIAERLPAAIAAPGEGGGSGPEEGGAYLHVLRQEVQRLNLLLEEIQRSILELRGGLHGDMQISELMETMMAALARDAVPASWEAMAYPSLRPLHAWVADVVERARQLGEWCREPPLLRVTWIAGLFVPQALLMAVAQTTARKNGWVLDQTEMVAEITKKSREDIAASARDGVYVHGLFLEGARWDDKNATLEACTGRQLCEALPVMLFKAIPSERKEPMGAFTCPIYKTSRRGKTFVFVADVKSKSPPSRWVLAGVAILLEVVAGT